jgi:hypothetical protein
VLQCLCRHSCPAGRGWSQTLKCSYYENSPLNG